MTKSATIRPMSINVSLLLFGAPAPWMSWIVQRRGNTWIFVISHAALNGLAMVRIVNGIIG